MSERERDQQRLVDFVLGKCSADQAREVQARQAGDKDFAAECQSLRRILATLEAYQAEEPPQDLAARTLARIRAARRTEALLESQRAARRSFAPTFSRRDLVAVAAVLALAAGILIPSLRQARRRADIALCAANVGQIGTGLGHFANSNNDALPGCPVVAENWLPRSGGKFASNSAGLFVLIRQHFTTPQVFQCPGAGGQAFVAADYMDDFPSRKTIDYSYQHSLSAPVRRQGELAAVAPRMAILADATPVFAGGVFKPERVGKTVSENHPDGVMNVLYLDLHVARASDCHVGVNGNNIWLAEGIENYRGDEKPSFPADSFLLPCGVP